MTAPTPCDCTDTPRIAAVCLCRSGATAIQALATIRRTLALMWLPEQIHAWMHKPCARLNARTPMALVMAGRGEDVISEARAIAGEHIR